MSIVVDEAQGVARGVSICDVCQVVEVSSPRKPIVAMLPCSSVWLRLVISSAGSLDAGSLADQH